MKTRGRPKIDIEEQKVVRLQVLLKQKEYNDLMKVVDEKSCSVSHAGRGIILEWLSLHTQQREMYKQWLEDTLT